jgi:hypothetical protein
MATEIIIPEVLPPVPDNDVRDGDWKFTETSYELDPNITLEQLDLLPLNDQLTSYKKTRTKALVNTKLLIMCFEALRARFKEEQPRDESGQFRPVGVTLEKAFKAIGLVYETEYKRYQRWVTAAKTPKLPAPKRPSSAGEFVENADGEEFVFVGNEPGKAKIVPLGGSLDEATTVPFNSLVRRRIKKVKLNDLILCTDNQKLYRCTDSGIYEENQAGLLLQQVKDRDDAEFEAAQKKSQQREEAAAKDKTEMKEYQRYGQPHNSEDQAAKDKAAMEKHRPPNKPKPAGKARVELKEVASEEVATAV